MYLSTKSKKEKEKNSNTKENLLTIYIFQSMEVTASYKQSKFLTFVVLYCCCCYCFYFLLFVLFLQCISVIVSCVARNNNVHASSPLHTPGKQTTHSFVLPWIWISPLKLRDIRIEVLHWADNVAELGQTTLICCLAWFCAGDKQLSKISTSTVRDGLVLCWWQSLFLPAR